MDELNDLPITFDHGRQVLLRRRRPRGGRRGHPEVAGAGQRQAAGVRPDLPAGRGEQPGRGRRRAGRRSREIESELPEGSKLEFVIDQSEYVRKAIESLIHEGIIGAILVSLMILVFLGNWRMTLIASLSLPLAILGAIIGLQTTGQHDQRDDARRAVPGHRPAGR